HFDITNLENELANLENQTNKAEFWSDSKNSSIVLKRITELKNKVSQFKKVKTDLDNLIEIKILLLQESDADLEKELETGTNTLETELEKLETSTLLSGKYDINNA